MPPVGWTSCIGEQSRQSPTDTPTGHPDLDNPTVESPLLVDCRLCQFDKVSITLRKEKWLQAFCMLARSPRSSRGWSCVLCFISISWQWTGHCPVLRPDGIILMIFGSSEQSVSMETFFWILLHMFWIALCFPF